VSREETFKALVRGLIQLGIYPGPTAINILRGKRGKLNALGTDHTRWRREELLAAGFTRYDATSKVFKNPAEQGEYTRFKHPTLRLRAA
jgi:hypothetical protein